MRLKTITARQMLLLYALRNAPIEAKNLTEYSWTKEHTVLYAKKLGDKMRTDDKLKLHHTLESEALTEAQAEIPALKSEFRTFGIHDDGNHGLELVSDGKETWYTTGIVPTGMDWRYSGEFELKKPLTEKESLLLSELLKNS